MTVPLSRPRLAAYGLPSLPLQAMMVPLLVTLPPFYALEVGIAFSAVGMVFLAGRLIDACADPVIGAISDRVPLFGSHRKSYMLAGAPVALLGCWRLLHPTAGATAATLLLDLVVFYLGWSLVFIPYQSWGAELSSRYEERTRIAGFREGFTFLGYLAATLLPIALLQWLGGIATPKWGEITGIVGTLFLAGLPAALLICLPTVPEPRRAAGEVAWSAALGVLRRNGPFRVILGFYSLDRFALGISLTLQPLLLQYVLGMQGAFLALSLASTVVSAASAPLWPAVAHRFGKLRAYAIANGIAIAGCLVVLVLPAGNLLLAAAFFVAIGLSQPGTLILPASMTADAIDWDHYKAGNAQAGLHVALLNLVFKVGLAAGIGASYLLLSMAGFDSALSASTPAASGAIRLMLGLLAPGLLLGVITLSRQYRIDERAHAAIQRAIARRSCGATVSTRGPAAKPRLQPG